MKKFNIRTKTRKLLADTITPVSIYLRIRDIYPKFTSCWKVRITMEMKTAIPLSA